MVCEPSFSAMTDVNADLAIPEQRIGAYPDAGNLMLAQLNERDRNPRGGVKRKGLA
jgi:hypothetical protein